MAQTVQLNIPLDYNQVMELIMQLPVQQKRKVLKSLEKELAADKKTYIPNDQMMVVKERLAAYKKNPSRGKSWKKVQKELDKKYR